MHTRLWSTGFSYRMALRNDNLTYAKWAYVIISAIINYTSQSTRDAWQIMVFITVTGGATMSDKSDTV